ncbi:MAG: hypothetical protein JNL32_12635 [Candidatus Kapabacteria bacterium]|nr:hypothetical protein [Candidatus Kapabacteria bacterium]
MNDITIRYSGPPTVRRSYMYEFLVHCPKCGHCATVTTEQSCDTSSDKLICQHCNHIEKKENLVRYNATVKRNCDNCGKLIDVTIPNNKKKIEELTLACSYCGQVRTYTPKHDIYGLIYKGTGACDPIFHLPLWFQTEIKGETFWAYNRLHLTEIRSYVSAKLRERQTTTHTTMVERLPNFIKAAKNRATIIKAIDKLLKK